ncbi:LysR substrate-binding domain-containing protein [Nocardioides sp. LS1]|uniref:LysR substrate-binding domain-containing protein n=1 Tax=Nocardioides sp. LS1 TaxID=1027620 RepID=UPI000F619B8E|nr:LysR substrate-binding domain-containing protein [Nocardioides sp. LS1]GCD88042.1 LysR family transcriptional regulator [Nocardioides sp. LS1]
MAHDKLLDGRLKLRHLTLAVTIDEHGTIVGAAQALHVTQPVVTRGLRELESILGVDLFDRGPRGVNATPFGIAFLDHARAVIAQLRQAERQLELLTSADIGTVTVGIHLAGANVILPRAIAAVKARHPSLTVVVRESTPDVLTNALMAGECDLVVGRLSVDPSAETVQRLLYREPIRLVTRADHPAQRLRAPRLDDLVQHPWILPLEQTALRAELEALFAQEGVDLPANRVECTSILTLRELLLRTDSVAALPRSIATEQGLRPLATKLRSIGRAVGVTTPANRPTSPATKALLDELSRQGELLEQG